MFNMQGPFKKEVFQILCEKKGNLNCYYLFLTKYNLSFYFAL